MNRLDKFEIVVTQKRGIIVAGVPQLCLYATAESVLSAVEALELKKTALEADLAAVGELEELDRTDRVGDSDRWAGKELRQFALKTGIVIGMITAAVIFCGILLTVRLEAVVDNAIYGLETNIDRLTTNQGKHFWSAVERELDRAADPNTELPEEKKQKLLSDIRTIANRWRPFVAEAASIFSDSAHSAPVPSPANR